MMDDTILSRWMTAAASAAVVVCGMLAYSPSAEACGGFFCDNTQPVNQAAERIIFSDNDDDTVTALVQIMYEGPAEDFAWVLPVPGTPEVDVSSDTAFDRLQTATNPVYRMNTTVEGECKQEDFMAGSPSAESAADGANNGVDDGEPQVEVVDAGQVGPYIYTTISLDPEADKPADVAVNWLETNGYDVTDMGPDVLGPYLEDGMNLIAFKLNKESDDGDIRPIRMTYDAELPMIPIKPTAVAANDDMGVMVWVLSEKRAIPSNYRSLRLNEALIDWFNPANNYEDVINRAASEANGQGFVTELAWPVDRELEPNNQFAQPVSLDEVVFSEFDQQNWDEMAQRDWTDDEGGLLRASSWFAGWDGYLGVINSLLGDKLDGTSAEEFARCIPCHPLSDEADIDGFDSETFIDQLEAEVIDPMIATQDLLVSRPYMTRLYTTMSPGDMTLDPVFDFNGSLGDYSHVHVAERIIQCNPHVTRNEAPWRAELPQGDVVYGEGNSWPISSEASSMPANRAIFQENTSGHGELVVDNKILIDEKLGQHNDSYRGDGSGCQTAAPAGTSLAHNLALALMMGAFGLLFMRSRRRQ